MITEGIEERIHQIQSIFIKSQKHLKLNDYNYSKCKHYLKSPDQYGSIKYEAFAYELALKDLASERKLESWYQFLKSNKAFSIQIHIGLGWAFGKLNKEIKFKHDFNDFYYWRIYDGYGYYLGLFRGRKITNLYTSGKFTNKALKFISIGIGRSLYYKHKGDFEKINLNSFPEEYLSEIWRGLGIAHSFVNGFKESMILSAVNKLYKTNFLSGALMCLWSKYQYDKNINIKSLAVVFDKDEGQVDSIIDFLEDKKLEEKDIYKWFDRINTIISHLCIDNTCKALKKS